MKKNLLVMFTLLLCSTVVFSQGTKEKRNGLDFGVHAGLVSTKLDSDLLKQDVIEERAKGGMILGVYFRINMGRLYLQPELNYTTRKSESEVKFELPNGIPSHLGKEGFDLKRMSLDVPVLLGLKIIKSKHFNLRAFAGPVASLNLDNKIESIDDAKETLKDLDFVKLVWNGKAGVGIDIWRFSLDVDYEFSLKDNIVKSFEAKNKMFNVKLGFRLF